MIGGFKQKELVLADAKISRFAAFVLIAAFLALFAVPAAALTSVSDCAVLNAPGETYQLTADVDKSADSGVSVCMDITAANITLNCQNHSLIGNEFWNTVGIRISADNVNVSNCGANLWFYGLKTTGSNGTVKNSNFSNNSVGIYAWSGSRSNLFYNNYLSGNGDNNARDNGATNRWSLPSLKGGPNIIGGPFLFGNYFDDYSGTYTLPVGIGTTPYPISGSALAQDSHPLTNNALIFTCDMVIAAPGEYALTGNVSCAGGNGISIASPDVVFDCQGFTVSGPGFGYGIYATEADNVTVKNCNVNGWTNGIFFNGLTDSVVDNSAASGNSRGIYFYNTTGSNVTNSNASGNSAEGFSARFSRGISYSNDEAVGNGGFAGFYLLAVPGATLDNVRASGNGWAQPYGGGYGIQLQWADGATVTDAVVSDQRSALCNYDSMNVLVDGGSFSSAANYAAIRNGEDCYFEDPAINTRYPWMNFPVNFTVQNAYIFSPSTGVSNSHAAGSIIVRDNTIAGNSTAQAAGCGGSCGDAAIVDHADSFASGAVIEGNAISGFSHGIEIATNGSVTGNTINVAGQALSSGGCNLLDATGNTQNGNPVLWSNQAGVAISGGAYAEIDLCGAPNSSISGTTVANGGGIFVFRSSNAAISGNTVSNVLYGIDLQQSYGGTVNGNGITTARGGIILDGSPGTVVAGNTVRNITYGAIPTAALWVSDHAVGINITNNTFADSNNGIFFAASSMNGQMSNNLIAFNTIANNTNYAVLLGRNQQNIADLTTIVNNVVCGNGQAVNSTFATNTVLANNTFCVALSSPADNFTTNSSVDFSALASNVMESGTQCALMLNGVANGTNYTANPPADSPSYNGVNLADGSYSWTVQCADADGNSGVAPARALSVNTTVALAAPIVSLDMNAITRLATNKINYMVVTASGGRATCRVLDESGKQLDTSHTVVSGRALVESVRLSHEGLQQLWMVCTNGDGMGKTSAWITYDGTAPTITASFANANVAYPKASLTYSVADNLGGMVSCIMQVGTAKYASTIASGGSVTTEVTFSSRSRTGVSVSCMDGAGNSKNYKTYVKPA